MTGAGVGAEEVPGVKFVPPHERPPFVPAGGVGVGCKEPIGALKGVVVFVVVGIFEVDKRLLVSSVGAAAAGAREAVGAGVEDKDGFGTFKEAPARITSGFTT